MTNPLRAPPDTSDLGRPEAYMRINEQMVACSLEQYVDWLNSKEMRRGSWVIRQLLDKDGRPEKRDVHWLEQLGSDEHIRQTRNGKGAQPIGRHITAYGRAA